MSVISCRGIPSRLRSSFTLTLTLLLAAPALIVGTAGEASAQDPEAPPQSEPMKVLVGTLSGAKTTSARDWIVAGIEQDSRFQVVGSDEGAGLKTGASSSAISEAALGLEADAVILGKSRFGKKGWSAELEIYDGKDGSLIEKVEVPGGSFQDYEAALTSGELYFPIVEKATGFPPPPPEPVEVEPEEESVDLAEGVEEAKEVETEATQPSPLDVTVGARMYSRAFRYTESLNQLSTAFEPLPEYNLAAAPLPFLQAHWYPAAHFTSGFAAHLGITAGYEQGVATTVYYAPEDQTFAQTHSLWYAGLRGRIPIKVATVGLTANYGSHSFALKDSADGSPGEVFPNVSYSHVELGGDVEFKLGSVLLGAQGAYLLILDTGNLGSDAWYPNAKGQGVHFSGYVGWAAFPALDILAGLDARAYGFDFNPVDVDRPDDRVAGGATDRYTSVWLGLRFKIPEKGGSVSVDGEASGETESDSFDDFD